MCMQSKDADLLKATHRLKTAFEEVSGYHNMSSDAVVGALKPSSRAARKKSHFDELAEDSINA